MRFVLLSVLGIVATMAVSVSCSMQETHARCHSSAECSTGQQCYRGYCVIADGGDLTATQTQSPQLGQPGANEAAANAPDSTMCETQSSMAVMATEGACCTAAASCYEGPAGTLGVGTCKAGTRSCVDGKLSSECSDSVMPHPESCANQGADDDCDGQLDNIAGRGDACMLKSAFGTTCGEGKLDCSDGMEALSCVRSGPEPQESCNHRDDDCDGQIDEGFEVSTDAKNCGMCGTSCGSDQLCCAGTCLAMSAASASGCPSCSTEHPCAAAASCCGGTCRDLKRDRRHCGACGHSCEQAERCCDGACSKTCAE